MHLKLTSALDQLTTMSVSSSVEPLYTAVVEQCGTGSGTVGENNTLYFTPPHHVHANVHAMLVFYPPQGS